MNQKTNDTSVTLKINRRALALFVGAITCILIFIGLFGAILVPKSTNGTSTYYGEGLNFIYLLSDSFDEIKALELAKLINSSGASFLIFINVITIISFFVATLGVLFVVGKTVYSIAKKSEINFTTTIAKLLTISMQYLFILFFFNLYTRYQNTSSSLTRSGFTLGWGGVLLTIGFFFGILALIIDESDRHNYGINKNNISSKIGVILMYFIGIFGLTTLSKVTTTTTSSGIVQKTSNSINPFSFLATLLSVEDTTLVKNYSSMKTLTIFSIIFAFIALAAFIYVLYNLINRNGKTITGKNVLISSIIYLGLFIFSNLFFSIAYSKSFTDTLPEGKTRTVLFGYTGIVGIVLGFLLVIAIICSYSKNKKTVKNTK